MKLICVSRLLFSIPIFIQSCGCFYYFFNIYQKGEENEPQGNLITQDDSTGIEESAPHYHTSMATQYNPPESQPLGIMGLSAEETINLGLEWEEKLANELEEKLKSVSGEKFLPYDWPHGSLAVNQYFNDIFIYSDDVNGPGYLMWRNPNGTIDAILCKATKVDGNVKFCPYITESPEYVKFYAGKSLNEIIKMQKKFTDSKCADFSAFPISLKSKTLLNNLTKDNPENPLGSGCYFFLKQTALRNVMGKTSIQDCYKKWHDKGIYSSLILKNKGIFKNSYGNLWACPDCSDSKIGSVVYLQVIQNGEERIAVLRPTINKNKEIDLDLEPYSPYFKKYVEWMKDFLIREQIPARP